MKGGADLWDVLSHRLSVCISLLPLSSRGLPRRSERRRLDPFRPVLGVSITGVIFPRMLAGTGLVGTKERRQLLHLSRMLKLDLTDFLLSSGVSTGGCCWWSRHVSDATSTIF